MMMSTFEREWVILSHIKENWKMKRFLDDQMQMHRILLPFSDTLQNILILSFLNLWKLASQYVYDVS